MFGSIRRHLKRRIHGDIQRKLVADCSIGTVSLVGIHILKVRVENARSEIHRTSLKPREGQDSHMGGLYPIARCAEFRASRGFVPYKVGPCTAEACGTHGLVGVHHYVMIRRLPDGIQIMVHHPLVIMPGAEGDDLADVSGFHRVVSVFIHQ